MNNISEQALAQILQKFEEMLLDPAVRHSEARLKKLLAEDFVEFGSSGLCYDRRSIVHLLTNSVQNEKLTLTDFKLVGRSNEIAVVTYVCECRDAGEQLVRKSLRSSMWKNIDGEWRLAFHQGTKSGTHL